MKSLEPRQCKICGKPTKGGRLTCSTKCRSTNASRMSTERRKRLGLKALGYVSVWNDGKI